MSAKKTTYASSGVSLEANEEVVRRIQQALGKTQDERVLAAPNGFAGLFQLFGGGRRYHDPVLVSCSDGVGTKVLLASQMERLETIGIDLVAMNVNDLVTTGATPLFFLDYVAIHQNVPARTAAIVESIARGCEEAGCALIGGETAEMPDLYRAQEFDLAGFAVGVVERDRIISAERVQADDAIIGLASSGVHSNGYTLVRKLFFEDGHHSLSDRVPGLDFALGEELLKPTRIYVKPILSLIEQHADVVRGMAHITGGGLPGNLTRILPPGCRAMVRRGTWDVPAIFSVMHSEGVKDEEMFRVFNMGIGMAVVVGDGDAQHVIDHFAACGIPAWHIGHITSGKLGVELVS